MATRTLGALALRPTGNAHGGYHFFSLVTGRDINRNQWTEVLLPADVVIRVHALAQRIPRGCTFSNRYLNPFVFDVAFVDEDDDSTNVPDDTSLDNATAEVNDDED